MAPAVHSPHHPVPRGHETGDIGPRHPAPRGPETGGIGPLDHGLREHAPGPEAGIDEPVLSRRVPQAHLAPELRRNGQGNAGQRTGQPVPDAAEARAALSRYQASRQAAKAMVDEGEAEHGRPAGGGWA